MALNHTTAQTDILLSTTPQTNRSSAVTERPRDAFCHWISLSHSKSFEMTTLSRACVIVLHCNYGHILYRFLDKARYWSKIAIFYTPPVFDAPVRGSPSKYCIIFGMETLEWCGYTTVKKFDDIFSRFDIIPASDGQTVKLQQSPRCAYVLRGKIIINNVTKSQTGATRRLT